MKPEANWKVIADFPDYEISDTGLVWSKRVSELISPYFSNRGMLYGISRGSCVEYVKSHLLVRDAFFQPIGQVDIARLNTVSRSVGGKDNSKVWNFISPSGDKVEVQNLKQYCLQNGLNYQGMTILGRGGRVNNGKWFKVDSHKGWRRGEENECT